MRTIPFLLGLFLALNSGWSQSADWTQVQDQNLVELRQSLIAQPSLPKFNLLLTTPGLNTMNNRPDRPVMLAHDKVPAAWNYEDLAFFCKLEVKMEKALNLPVKVRLGEVQTVERMEGKLKTHFAGKQ